MRLFIDLDNTVVDLLPYWLENYNRDYGEQVTVDQITDWDLHNCLRHGEAIYSYLTREGFFLHAPAMPDAVDVLKFLSFKHEVYLVTFVDSVIGYKEKREWVDKHLSFIGTDRLLFVRQRHLLAGDLLFDDCPRFLRNFPGITVAMDYPYNRDVDVDFRVKTWLEFYEVVRLVNWEFERLEA